MDLPDGPHLVEIGEHQPDSVLDPPVRVLVDPIPADAHIADGNRHEQLTAACLLAERLVGALAYGGQEVAPCTPCVRVSRQGPR